MSDSNESMTYRCLTQYGYQPTIAAAPASQLKPNVDSIVLGVRTVIPRWKSPTTLKWFVDAGTFPSADEATAAAEAFDQAAKEWNDVAFGITISQTTDKKAANFNLVYEVNPTDAQRVYARAFFPHQIDEDVVVFKYGMDPANRFKLKNVFLHELGHVFGLRHEFAIDREGEGARQFMDSNKDSVMAYNKVPMIQETDKEGLREFYKLADRAKVDGSPVTDYLPQLRSTNQSGS